MTPVELVRLPGLMRLGGGRPEVAVALIDGPVVLGLPDFAGSTIREIPGRLKGTCTRANTIACTHGTFVAGILFARRGSVAPAICPGCTMLLRPIFAETTQGNGQMPGATPEELAEALVECVNAGARVINLSSAVVRPSRKGDSKLEEALEHAASRGAITVAATGNQGVIGSSAITRHPWVIPVTACDVNGVPLTGSNLGNSIGRRGLSAPGSGILSLGTDGKPKRFDGTSAAAPFVTGAIALLWSEFSSAEAASIKMAVLQASGARRRSIAPPVLDAWGAYQVMASAQRRRPAA